ncbi:hypothetical protein RDV64_15960 [Acuticoccus sp. MNP-M23]|uniref:hypothetical protein n=1 Tax=Acuticoccus sp. MNP-M23 TaxID=3072793 RepID=UPI0028168331|nr:hypothetical protein [Acuticoccus sp. MNP-M23]WMS41566.1 hypothetical protein RDV64_15960 [Acuticoccus sp. MNP-M23]
MVGPLFKARRVKGCLILAALVFLAPLPLAAADLVAGQSAHVVAQPSRVFVRQDVYEETLVLSPPPAIRGRCGHACGTGAATRTVRKAKERYWSRAVLVPAPTVRVVTAPAPRAVRPRRPLPRVRPAPAVSAHCLLRGCDR